jgi:energy-coupling factor transport system substrate-specific component
MWIGTHNRGIYIAAADGELTHLTTENGLNGTNYRSFVEMDDGTMVAGGNSGVSYINIAGKSVTGNIGAEDGLVNTFVLCLLKLNDGKILAGTDGGGIAIIDGGKVTRIVGKEDGLSSRVILRMVANSDGNGIYIVTSNSICYMDNNCENVRVLDRFPYNNNYDIVIGEDGTAFVLSSAGIYVVDEADLLEDGEDTVEYKLFDAERGFKKSLTPNAWNYIDEDDNLYLSTDTGVVYMNLDNYDAFSGSYRMTIESIIVDGVEQEVEHGQEIHVARDAEKIEIVPRIINYTINTPYISVYLEGVDDEPQIMLQNELTDSVYANLPVGTYTYHIAVLDSKGRSVVSECSVTIIKDKEIYDNWWFYVYVIVLFAAAVAYLTWLFFRTQIERTINMQKKELQLARDQIEMGNETVLTIARTVDAKDENTSQHSFRVSEYSVMIAKKLGFSDEECENLRKTALLHDIGKIGIPDRVLNKPGRLTDEEYSVMKSHVVKGSEILSTFKLIDNVADGALYHHERYDGTGYVHGLKGEEIPLNARIIGIADAFDAMTANRVYRKRLDIDYVIGELHSGRGTQFDPKLVDIMLGLIESGEIDVERIYADC